MRFGLKCLLILLLVATAHLSSARMGYEITATVDSTQWHISRSIQWMNCSHVGYVNGSGYFSEYRKIENGFGGLKEKRQSYALSGNLSYEDQSVLFSREGPVIIAIELETGGSEIELDPENQTETSVGVTGYAKIDVEERWPAYMANYKKIKYVGPLIETSERYENNGDVVSTYITSWDLSKESLYRSQINRTYITANVTSSGVDELIAMNKSLHYSLDLKSVGHLTHLGIQKEHSSGKADRYGRPPAPADYISEDYSGLIEQMRLKVDMSDSVKKDDNKDDWIACCYSGPDKTDKWIYNVLDDVGRCCMEHPNIW